MKQITRTEIESTILSRIQGLDIESLADVYKFLFGGTLLLEIDSKLYIATPFDIANRDSKDMGNPEHRGTRIYSRDGSEYGVSLGICGEYNGEAGRTNRISVIWKDEKSLFRKTKPTVAGLKYQDGHWRLR